MCTTVYLVSCVSAKLDRRAPAADLYRSPWFRLARAYVEHQRADWYVLSAKHLVISPDTVIAPYEQTLNKMPVAARREWAERVLADLARRVRPDATVVFLAGARYREFLIDGLRARGNRVEVPMEGLTIGRQLSWLKKHT